MKYLNKQSLKHKILIYTIVISSVMSTIFTLSSLFLDYRLGVGKMDERIKNIEITTLGSLKGSLWDLNINLIKVQLNDLFQLEGITEIQLVDENNINLVHLKKEEKERELFDSSFLNKYPLYFDVDGEKVYGGTFFLRFTRNHILEEIVHRALIVFLTQAAKTFVVSFLLLLLYEKLITHDLVSISQYFKKLDIATTETVEGFKNKRENEDEISIIQNQIENISRKLVDLNIENKKLLDQANKEKKLQEAKALNAARLASLGEMAAGIAHEINNPLTIIKSGIYAVEKKIKREHENDLNFQGDVNFERINNGVNRISKIIKNMKKISRDGSHEEIASLKLKDALIDSFDYFHEKLRSLDIEFKVADIPEQYITVSEVEFAQVLMNLLNNALDAINDNDEKWISIDFKSLDQFLEIRITDSGKGIDEATLDKIFAPFFTTKEIGKGTGLGLSISKESIEKMGGSLYYDSESANTTFVLRVRLSPQ
ncbi:ATP-binding protein [Bacteriovorax sp. Seq25_V]|uniref:sensor histidine kinase n=1 Tax=Bacteriovorax sp. Seq25_V TaxID=1201288 RepID=UPI000551530E|nr:ATP-binding protein [Bacteriovorax sp. Seq25_V]